MPVGDRLGGAEKVLWLLLRELDRSRFEVHVVFLTAGTFASEIESLGFRTTTIEAGRLRQAGRFVWTVRALARIFRRERPDLIISWIGKPHLYAWPAAMMSRLGDRTVWWQHAITSGWPLDWIITLLPARAIGAVSHASAASQRRLRPRRPVFVVHNGIEDERPSDPEACRATGRTLLGVGDGDVIVTLVGRLQRQKGQHHVIAALALAHSRGIPVHGVFVGGDAFGLDPTYPAELRKLTTDLGLDGHVTFTGHVSDPAPYLWATDIWINASKGENLSLALLEAMAAERPIVAVDDAGGTREMVTDGQTAILVPSPDPQLLADAIERLAGDDALRMRLGRSARERFLAGFDHRKMTRRVEAELERLIREGDSSAPVAAAGSAPTAM
jgi:glycosyltransferase involved in cell wall biosynthesis